MTRARRKLLNALIVAAAENDSKQFVRLYCEHRVSRKVAAECWEAGRRQAEAVAKRDREACHA